VAIEDISNQASRGRQVLATHPSDAAANFAVGKFLCFYKGDWAAGLPFLARGSDANAKGLAVTELAGSHVADVQLALGDGWWDLGEKSPAVAQRQLQLHAAGLYQAAAPMSHGLTAQKIKLRTAQAFAAAGITPPAPVAPPAAVVPPSQQPPSAAPGVPATADSKFAELTAAMNSMSNWTVTGGNWEMTPGKHLRGTGISDLRFNSRIYAPFSMAFRLKATNVTRLSINFNGPGFTIDDEGGKKGGLTLRGKLDDLVGDPYRTNSGEEMQVRVSFDKGHVKLQINDHLIEGKTNDFPWVRIELHCADVRNRGSIEAWGFVVSPLSPTADAADSTHAKPTVADRVATDNDDPIFAGLTAGLNRLADWKANYGTWTTTADKKLRGSNESELQFGADIPCPCSIEFHMKVLKGSRPQISFDGPGVILGDDGKSHTIMIRGTAQNVTGDPYPYQVDQDIHVRISFIKEHFKLQMNDHLIEGNSPPTSWLKIRLSGGDWKTKGTTEFWGFVATRLVTAAN
jgi:hypothetical protein